MLVECLVHRSKVDQVGKGATVCPYRLHGSSVGALRDYLNLRKGILGPLLIHEDGSFLSRFQFLQVT